MLFVSTLLPNKTVFRGNYASEGKPSFGVSRGQPWIDHVIRASFEGDIYASLLLGPVRFHKVDDLKSMMFNEGQAACDPYVKLM